MAVIDFRARPNTEEYVRYLSPRLDAIEKQTGKSFGSYRAPKETLDRFVTKLDEAGISRAVFAARNRTSSKDWFLTNDFVAKCVAEHPSHLIGFAGIDLSDLRAVREEIKRAIEGLKLSGICIDPFQIGVRADDSKLNVVYDTCCDLGVPVIVTMGGMPGVPVPLDCGNPLALDFVADRYPELLVIGSHAGWPFVHEMIAVAWRRQNVYFENSFYHFAPGAELLVEAANTMIPDKMLYASAYPFAPLQETLERFKDLSFHDNVREKVLFGNAARLLKIAN